MQAHGDVRPVFNRHGEVGVGPEFPPPLGPFGETTTNGNGAGGDCSCELGTHKKSRQADSGGSAQACAKESTSRICFCLPLARRQPGSLRPLDSSVAEVAIFLTPVDFVNEEGSENEIRAPRAKRGVPACFELESLIPDESDIQLI